jgi:hypothetical protein
MDKEHRNNTPRINPARFREKPAVVDANEAADLLRVSVEHVRELTRLDLLRRLSYTRNMLYDQREVQRFLTWSTETRADAYKQAVADARALLEGSASERPEPA